MTPYLHQRPRRWLAIALATTAAMACQPWGQAAPPHQQQPSAVTNSDPNSRELDVKALGDKADMLKLNRNYAEAALIWRQLLSFAKDTLGYDDPAVAISLNNLAELLQLQGQYKGAESLYRQSLQIYEKALSGHHPYVELTDIAFTLNELAKALSFQGKLKEAQSLARRSIGIYEKAHGPDHPAIAITISNLAKYLADDGQHNEADQLYRRSLAIREKTLGPNHLDVALSLNNLAGLLQFQGQYAAAEEFYRRSLVIREKTLGPNHADVAVSLNNLAVLLNAQEQLSAAEPLSRRSLAILEKTLGSNHHDVALVINNLANILHKKGLYSDAARLYRRSIAIQEKIQGLDSFAAATPLGNLATLLDDEGKYDAAEVFYRRSLAIREKTLGPNHLDVALSLKNLAGLLQRQGQYEQAITALRRSLAIESEWLTIELPLLPESARSLQVSVYGKAWLAPFWWIDRHPPANKLALETRLNRHGLLLELEQRQALLLSAPSVNRAQVQQLQTLTQQLASVSLAPERRTALRQQRDRIQSELYRQIPELQIQLVTPAQVASALPADGVLVEFQRYQPFDGRKGKNERGGEPQYIALVLKPNGSISAVPLGAAAAIDAQVQRGLSASAQDQSDAEVNWAQLSNQVLKPLLVGSRQWFLSPDGELNRVPFAALPAPEQPGKPLAQVVQLRVLTTGRELLRLQQPAPAGSEALVMANPSYDRPGIKQAPAVSTDAVSTADQRHSAELSSNKWAPLPASEREGQQVASLLRTGLISGSVATAMDLQRQQGPRVLHIATHGFFVADQESKPLEAMSSIQVGSPLLRTLRQEDPQLRSGLVLAGANQPDVDPKDDGYLTAAEAVNLNLKGTELVVLSACSTGQGEVRTGEGVYGLQRSLTVAGARSTLLSLWKVDDAATAEFMIRFYKRLKAGEGRSDALAKVQEDFRTGKVKSPDGSNWKEPYYWAAWQLVGDWRPIKGF